MFWLLSKDQRSFGRAAEKLARLIDFLNHSSRTDAIGFLNTKKIFFEKKNHFSAFIHVVDLNTSFSFRKNRKKNREKKQKNEKRALLSRFDDLATLNFIFDTVSNFQCDV